MSIASMVENLKGLGPLSVAQVTEALGSFDYDAAWCAEQLAGGYPDDQYSRVLLHTDAHFEVVLAIWPQGAATPPHDHGVYDSQGAALVLNGEVFNQVYSRLHDGCLCPSDKTVHGAGELIRVPQGLVHMMGSTSGEHTSLSLHIYSPGIVEPSYWDAASLEPVPVSESLVT